MFFLLSFLFHFIHLFCCGSLAIADAARPPPFRKPRAAASARLMHYASIADGVTALLGRTAAVAAAAATLATAPLFVHRPRGRT